MILRIIKGDRRTIQVRHLQNWLRSAAKLRRSIYNSQHFGFDPFAFNETATVGFLASAAGRASLYALPEHAEVECRRPDGSRPGRCDLWLASEDNTLHWSIEFKVCWYRPGSDIQTLRKRLKAAIKCARTRSPKEAKERWACTVFSPIIDWTTLDDGDLKEWESLKQILKLADEADLAFRIEGEAGPVFLLFKRAKRGAPLLKRNPEQLCARNPAIAAA